MFWIVYNIVVGIIFPIVIVALFWAAHRKKPMNKKLLVALTVLECVSAVCGAISLILRLTNKV